MRLALLLLLAACSSPASPTVVLPPPAISTIAVTNGLDTRVWFAWYSTVGPAGIRDTMIAAFSSACLQFTDRRIADAAAHVQVVIYYGNSPSILTDIPGPFLRYGYVKVFVDASGLPWFDASSYEPSFAPAPC